MEWFYFTNYVKHWSQPKFSDALGSVPQVSNNQQLHLAVPYRAIPIINSEPLYAHIHACIPIITTDDDLGLIVPFHLHTYIPFQLLQQVMTWDDHDIFDGWGSYAMELQFCPVFQGVFFFARKFFCLFQQHTTPERIYDHNQVSIVARIAQRKDIQIPHLYLKEMLQCVV